MHDELYEVIDGLNKRLQLLYGTANPVTYVGFGTGSMGIEAALANTFEEGDELVMAIGGRFAYRAYEIATSQGLVVHCIKFALGEEIDLDKIEHAIVKHSRAKGLYCVLGESSSGVMADGPAIARIARDKRPDMLRIVDAVPILGGAPIATDLHQYDLVFAGSQKCLSTPPGGYPLTISPRLVRKIISRWEAAERRGIPLRSSSWVGHAYRYIKYMALLDPKAPREYHTTAMTQVIAALAEATCLIIEEDLASVFTRHAACGDAFRQAVQALDLTLRVPQRYAMPMLTSVKLPDGVKAAVILATCDDMDVIFSGGMWEWSDDTAGWVHGQ